MLFFNDIFFSIFAPMQVAQYISELLYRYNCVVVPNFGAFLANTVSARIDTGNHTLYPPTKSLSFNQQLTKNDGLLVSHMANAKKLPYEELLMEVNEISKQWTERLESGKHLFLEGIGRLTMNEAHKIQFMPEEGYNYLTSSYGLSSFSSTPITREKLKEEIEQWEERAPLAFTPEKREGNSFRPLMKYAALFLLLVATGASGYQFYHQNKIKQQLVQIEAQEQVEKYIQEATFFENSPLELPALNIKVKKKSSGPQHHIIAGAFRFRENADKKIAQLKGEGYSAHYLGTNKYGLHQVAYASFSDSQEALQFLRKIKRTVSLDAWMLSEK